MLLKLGTRGPLYVRVYDALRRSMIRGQLGPGSMLPGTRELATDLGVSRTVVLQAYALLDSEGYTTSRAGVGTFVSDTLPDETLALHGAEMQPRPPVADVPLSRYASRLPVLDERGVSSTFAGGAADLIDMRFGDTIADGRALDRWQRALAQSSRRSAVLGREPPAWGLQALRAVVAEHLRKDRGVDADAESVVIVGGAQQALDLIGRVLIDEGTVVGLEESHYDGARAIFGAFGARLVGCPVDADGMDIERGSPALRDARVLMVLPSHQFPSGAVMPIHRRKALLQWVYRHSVYVIEEDIDCEYRYGISATPSLHSMDRHQRVIYIGSFARMLLPGLRLGFLVVPPHLRERFRIAKELADKGCSGLLQLALLDFVVSGEYERGRRRLQRSMDRKRRLLIAALHEHLGDAVVIHGADAGIFISASLPKLPMARLGDLIEEAYRRGLRVYSTEPYYLDACTRPALVMGYGATDASRMDEAGRRLAAAYRAVWPG